MKTIDKLNKGQRVAYLDERTGRRKCGQYLGMICGHVLVRRLDRNTEREWWTHELIDRQQLIPRTGKQYARMIGYLQGKLNARHTDNRIKLEQMVLDEMLAMGYASRDKWGDVEWRTDLCDDACAGFGVALKARVRTRAKVGG